MLPRTSSKRFGDYQGNYESSEESGTVRTRGLLLGIPSESRMRQIRMSGSMSGE